MKTPDEIKRALACYGGEMGCPDDCDVCALNTDYTDWHDVMNDARAYIQRLEGQVVAINKTLEQVTRERDALMEETSGYCSSCVFLDDCAKHDDGSSYDHRWYFGDCEDWEWRGVSQEGEHGES